MPLVDRDPDEIMLRTNLGVDEPVNTGPTNGVLQAAFRQENVVTNLVDALSGGDRPAFDPSYDLFEDIKGTKYYERYKDRFTYSGSKMQSARIKQEIDREERDREILDANGWAGTGASILAGVLDPTMFLPGGAFYKSGRIGYDVYKTARSVAIAGGSQAALQEGILQGTQQTRDPMTSYVSIGAGTILGGLIGGGAAALLSKSERKAFEKLIDDVASVNRTEVESRLGQPSAPQSAGAAAADTRTMELRRGPIGEVYKKSREAIASVPYVGRFVDGIVSIPERLVMNTGPNVRVIYNSMSLAAKRAVGDLTEIPLEMTDAARGVSQTQFINAVDRAVRDEMNTNVNNLLNVVNELYSQYRYGKSSKLGAIMDSGSRLIGGGDGFMSKAEFDAEIATAMRNADTHPNPIVQQAARAIRSSFYDPWAQRAKKLGYLPDDLPPGAEVNYLNRMYDKDAIRANPRGFTEDVLAYLKEDQAKKATAQSELVDLHKRLTEAEDMIDRLSARLDTKERQMRDTGIAIRERRMEAKASNKRTNALIDRVQLIQDSIEDIRKFIEDAKVDLQKPEFTTELDALRQVERDLLAAEKAATFTEKDLAKAEKAEAEGIMQGSLKRGAEIFIGKRRMPKTYDFLDYLVANGGVNDFNGDVTSVMGGAKVKRGLIKKYDQGDTQTVGMFAGGGQRFGSGKARSLDQWGEKLFDEFPEAFTERLSTDDVLDLIDRASRGEVFDWLQSWSDADREAMAVAAMLEDLFRGDPSPDTVNGLVDIFKYDNPQTAEDFERKLADMEAVGATIPVQFEREGVSMQINVKREEIAAVKQLIANAREEKAKLQKSGKLNTTRRVEAEIASARNIGRLGVLNERMRSLDLMQTLLERARANADEVVVDLRAKVEDIINKWEGKTGIEARAALKARAEREADREMRIEAGIYNGKNKRMTGADSAVDKAVRDIIASDRMRSDDELRGVANEIMNRILGTPDGRLPYDAHKGGPTIGSNTAQPVMRGSLAARDFAMPDQMLVNGGWLVNDMETLINTYARTVIPDVILGERFGGDFELTSVMKSIENEYGNLIAKASTEEGARLRKQMDEDIRDIAAIRDRIRNVYGYSSSSLMRNVGRAAEGIKAYNVLTDMGGMVLSQLPDLSGHIFRFGLENTFKRAWGPYLNFLATGLSDAKTVQEIGQLRAMGAAIEVHTNLRADAIGDLTNQYAPGSALEKGLRGGANKLMLANLSAYATDGAKLMAGSAAMHQILASSRRVAEEYPRLLEMTELARRAQDGDQAAIDAISKFSDADAKLFADAPKNMKSLEREMRDLAAAYITPDLAVRIWKQFSEVDTTAYKNLEEGLVPNTDDWTDEAAVTAFRSAVNREIDIAVVTPGQETPLFLSNPVMSVLGQFKRFATSATTRILLANLQRADGRSLAGIIAAVGLGMMAAKVYTVVAGRDTSNYRAQDWVKEGISRSGILGWLEELNTFTAKATGGTADIYKIIGADKPLSKYSSRSAFSALLGPSVGKIENVLQVSRALATGEASQADVRAFRRLLPLQNLFYVRWLFDAAERGGADVLDLPETRK